MSTPQPVFRNTVRLGILKQLTDYMSAEISIANGYQHDLAGCIFRGRIWYSADDPIPLISILEGINPDQNPQTAGYGQDLQSDKWVLLIQGWCEDDPINPTDPGHILMGDVKMALGKLRQALANMLYMGTGTAFEYVAEIEIEPGVVRPPNDLSIHAFFWLRAVLTTVEEVSSPFL